jgi:hypothetical protein
MVASDLPVGGNSSKLSLMGSFGWRTLLSNAQMRLVLSMVKWDISRRCSTIHFDRNISRRSSTNSRNTNRRTSKISFDRSISRISSARDWNLDMRGLLFGGSASTVSHSESSLRGFSWFLRRVLRFKEAEAPS